MIKMLTTEQDPAKKTVIREVTAAAAGKSAKGSQKPAQKGRNSEPPSSRKGGKQSRPRKGFKENTWQIRWHGPNNTQQRPKEKGKKKGAQTNDWGPATGKLEKRMRNGKIGSKKRTRPRQRQRRTRPRSEILLRRNSLSFLLTSSFPYQFTAKLRPYVREGQFPHRHSLVRGQ